MPPAEYYELLKQWRRKQHPKADPHLLDHLDVLEPFLDLCIVSGFSLGAEKSRDKIAQHRIQFLGELVGRLGREATDHRLRTVREFKIVEDVPSLRRFLGSFGWIPGALSLGGRSVLAYTYGPAQEGSCLAPAS